MALPKDFDCVKMKDEIQRKLRERWKNLSEGEIREQMRRDLETSQSPIAQWWRRVRDQHAAKRG